MAESETDPVAENTSRVSRAMLGRISAVGLFVVLGTFAVIQSMGSAKHDDEALDESDSNPKTASVISGESDAIPTATSAAFVNVNTTLPETKPFSTRPSASLKPQLPSVGFPGQDNDELPTNLSSSPFEKTELSSGTDTDTAFEPAQAELQAEDFDDSASSPPPERYAHLPGGAPLMGSTEGYQDREDPAFGSSKLDSGAGTSNPNASSLGDPPEKPPTQTPSGLLTDDAPSGSGSNPPFPGQLQPPNAIASKAELPLGEIAEQTSTDSGGRLADGPSNSTFPNNAPDLPSTLRAPAIESRSPESMLLNSTINQNRITTSDFPLGQGAPSTPIGTGVAAAKFGSSVPDRAFDSGNNTDDSTQSPDRGNPYGNPSTFDQQPSTNPTFPRSDLRAETPGSERDNPLDRPLPTVAPARPLRMQPTQPQPYGQPQGQQTPPAGTPLSNQSTRVQPYEPPKSTNAMPVSAMPVSASRRSDLPMPGGLRPTPSMASSATASLTKNVAGDRQLEGMQSPALTMEKLSPREIQLNQPADFQIIIKNVGNVTADNVLVFDKIPAGTEFLGASPKPRLSANRGLEWNIGSLRPDQEVRIKLKLKPTRPGEIGSVAQFTFSAQASMRTLVTKPVLEITHQTKQSVLIGDDVLLDVTVKNKGDGPAKNVLIQEDVPRQLEFQDGYRELEYDVGTLLPGQSRQIQLALKAADIGKFRNVVFATADGGLQSQHGIDMEIVAPKLVATAKGPTRRFLQRNVTHTFSVSNQGTAPATNVELIARLPSGLRFISANNQGEYVASKHAVFWSLPALARAVDANVELKTVPVEVGSQPIKFEAFADLNTRSNTEQPLSVEHNVDIFFSIDDVIDTIEIGASTSYQIRIVNQGTKVATNVQFQVNFPNGIQPTSVEGSLKHRVTDQTVLFDPINSLAPGDEISVVVHGTGTLEGDHRVVLTMKTDGRTTPVSKEETTRVYSDH